MTNPRVFISYSWSSPIHQQWVIDLSEQLRAAGVDIILDKWDLKEGHDAVHFMEKMSTDPSVDKVIMVFDKTYSEKSNSRTGGVGTETQIITSEIYSKSDQSKFVGIASELDDEGEPYRPGYYKSRIYIDMSSIDNYDKNFEQLLRWIYNKPFHVKPPIGKMPAFLNDTAASLGTSAKASRAKQLASSGAASIVSYEDYLESFISKLETMSVNLSASHIDDEIVRILDEYIPLRNEIIDVTVAHLRGSDYRIEDALVKFFETLIHMRFPPEEVTSYTSWQYDAYKFIAYELIIYFVAIFCSLGKFSELGSLLSRDLFIRNNRRSRATIHDFSVIFDNIESLSGRNERLGLRRISLQADMVVNRATHGRIKKYDLLQADFIMYVRDMLHDKSKETYNRWYPMLAIYMRDINEPFEIFAKSRSALFFNRIKPVLGITSKADIDVLVKEFDDGIRKAPRFNFDQIAVGELLNAGKIGSRP